MYKVNETESLSFDDSVGDNRSEYSVAVAVG